MISQRRPWIALAVFAAVSLGACAPSSQAPPSPDRPAASPAPHLLEISTNGLKDVPQACLEAAGKTSGGRQEVEPHAAVSPADPDHIVAAWILRGIGVIQATASFDGGRSWTPPRTLPFNACAGGPIDVLSRASDPWVAIGPEGRVYVSAIAFQPTDGADASGAVLVVSSGDGGRTWDTPGVASLSRTPEIYHDNTAITADPRIPATAYVLATRYEGRGGYVGPAALSKTVDGGKTWSPIRPISPRSSFPADCPQMVIDPHTGHLFVFYTHGENGASMSFLRSEDSGETWSRPMPVMNGIPWSGSSNFPGTSTEVRIAEDIGHPAVDPRTGRLYALFTSGWATGGESLQVGLVTSGDGGSTWSPPLRVSADSAAGAWRPALAIDAAGRVMVSYFTPTTEEPVHGEQLPVSVHLVDVRLEPDGSLVRGQDRILDRFSWSPAPQGGYFLGDYNPLLAVRDGFLLMYGRSFEKDARTVAVRAR